MGLRILHFDAETGAVCHPVGEECRQPTELRQHFAVSQRLLQSQQHSGESRILTCFRCGGMR